MGPHSSPTPSASDGSPLLPHQDSEVNEKMTPLFPLDKETMIWLLQPVSAASLVCITIINVSTALNLGPAAGSSSSSVNYPHVRAIMASLPYAFLPLGFSGLAAAVAAKKRPDAPDLLGCASGCLLGEAMFTSIIRGGVVDVVQAGADPWEAAAFTLMVLANTVFGWSVMCSYPKFLRRWRAAKASDPEAPDSRRQPASIVTKPRMAQLVTVSSILFAAAVIGMFVYTTYLHFKIDGPLWEALVSCVVESPLFVAPLCMLPLLTDAFVAVYATGGDAPSFSKPLLAYENV